MPRIGFVCPVYRALEFDSYTRRSLESFFDTTPGGVAIVVDDHSPDWTPEYARSLESLAVNRPGAEIHLLRFDTSGGLTRSWNAGLTQAQTLGLDYAIAGNNDIVFTLRWQDEMLSALDRGYALVGPLSNAPGTQPLQEVQRYCTNYQLTDHAEVLDQTAAELYRNHRGRVLEQKINGFFQMAAMATWEAGKYDAIHYYCPSNPFTSRGLRNPTPLMTLNEDELQARWHRSGKRSAIVLSSFIFHYRAVSRGESYKRGNWYRQS